MSVPESESRVRAIAYGPAPNQVGDLYLPGGGRMASVICLLHGGFWRMPWGREHIAPIAVDLMQRGFGVWNLEYRRVGQAGGGWPGTLDDVAEGVGHLSQLAAQGEPIDPTRLTVIGHSAGGHLALWVAQRYARVGPVRITEAVGLAAVADLRLCHEMNAGKDAVRDLMGGTPETCVERYATSSPAELLPLGVEQLLIHGTHDEDVPVQISRRYARAARAAGDAVTFFELADTSHMDFVDPRSAAHGVLCRWLARRALMIRA